MDVVPYAKTTVEVYSNLHFTFSFSRKKLELAIGRSVPCFKPSLGSISPKKLWYILLIESLQCDPREKGKKTYAEENKNPNRQNQINCRLLCQNVWLHAPTAIPIWFFSVPLCIFATPSPSIGFWPSQPGGCYLGTFDRAQTGFYLAKLNTDCVRLLSG